MPTAALFGYGFFFTLAAATIFALALLFRRFDRQGRVHAAFATAFTAFLVLMLAAAFFADAIDHFFPVIPQ